jgi:peptidase E
MKLFLASEAKHPDCIKKLDALINGLKGKSIAYIPTASNGENPYGQWQTESTTWKLVNTLDANVTPVSLEDYKDSSVIDALKGKDIIWFAGGACGYLMYWIRRCELDKHLLELLDSGSVYVGSSAGSMVAAQTLSVTEWYLGEGEPGASIFPGLSLIDFEIYPHYEDEMLPEIKKHWDGKKLCLLKNGEAITVIDGKTTIFGEERFLESKSY